MAFQEIVLILENAGTNAQNISKQLKAPAKDWSIGTKEDVKK